MINRRVRRRLGELPVHLLLAPPIASVLFLLYYLASNALKPTVEFYQSEVSIPHSLHLSAISDALGEGKMLIALRNSLILTGSSVLLALGVGAAAAFALARLRVPARTTVFVAMLVPMAVSPLIVTIPLFAQMSQLGLVNTFAGAILIYLGLRLSFTIYVLEGVFRDLPDGLFEAARIDGASEFHIFSRIVLPLAAPGLVAVSIVNMLEVWNDLVIGYLFLSNDSVRPLTATVVSLQQKFASNPQRIFAGLLLGALPMLILYGIFQRAFVKGLMGGAFK